MPRKARIQSVTDYYHVMIRGISKEFVFKTKEQKEKLLKLIIEQMENELIEVGAWCIMDNHVHLLIKANLEDMSKAIKIINLKYAAYYNNSKQRTGPVFGDRYKSENIEDDKYFLGVLRYIHNNPLNAKLVHNIEEYKWSSYHTYLSNEDRLVTKEIRDLILSLIGASSDKFREFHNKKDDSVFLDTKEEMERVKFELGQKIIAEIFTQNGIVDAKELKLRPNIIDDLVKRLSEKSNLSIRQISKLTGLSIGNIYSAINE